MSCDCGKIRGPHDPDCSSWDECASECDCMQIGILHDEDCNIFRKCDEGRYCDKHFKQAEKRNRRPSPSQAEIDQDLRDAGRGHLVADYWADRIDYARMIAKERQ
jgi:hypothetical protein